MTKNNPTPTSDGLKLLTKYYKLSNGISNSAALKMISSALGFSTSNALIAAVKKCENGTDEVFEFAPCVSYVNEKAKDFFDDIDEKYRIREFDIEDGLSDSPEDTALLAKFIVTGGVEHEYGNDDTINTLWLTVVDKNSDTILASLRTVRASAALDFENEADTKRMRIYSDDIDMRSPDSSYPFMADAVVNYSIKHSARYLTSGAEEITYDCINIDYITAESQEYLILLFALLMKYSIIPAASDPLANYLCGIEIKYEDMKDIRRAVRFFNTLSILSSYISYLPRDTGLSKIQMLSPEELNLDYKALNYIAMLGSSNGRSMSSEEWNDLISQVNIG